MSRFVLAFALLISTPAMAVDFILGAGPDIQGTDNTLDRTGTTYENADDQVTGGGSVAAYLGLPLGDHFGLRPGVQIVSRFIKQDYNNLFGSDNGKTGYDAVTVDVPLFFDFYMGEAKNHRLYLGPAVGFKVYEHCEQSIQDPADAYPCQDDAVKDVFALVQGGYMVQFGGVFGLTFFIEYTPAPIIDKDRLEAKMGRTGVLFTFFL
jgi:hypothetical protein